MYIPGVDKLIGKIQDVIANEAELIWSVPHEIKDFKTELENMQACLIDADQGEMQFAEEVEKKWVADIREKSYEAEDIIDEFTYHMNKHQHDISCLSWFLHLLVEAPTTLWVMRQTAHKLKKIKKSITDIAERHARYKPGVDASARARARYLEQKKVVTKLRDRSYLIEEGNFIGFHREIESLEKWLTGDTSSRNVILVHGMGGAGKTTLAGKIFKSQRVGFELSEWVTISQTYSINELLRSLIKKNADISIKGVEHMSYAELVEALQGCLKGKKYLIVLDDVWDTNCWELMKVAFTDDEVGSRILITTRNESIAPSPYKLHIGKLQRSEPWDLFSMKAFADWPNKTCPQELGLLARKLVDKCGGLPLALVTLGSCMSSKKKEKEWIDAGKNMYKTGDMGFVESILMLSFNDLPYSLKHCFLYCCLSPEDYPIRRTTLIRKWMAEGFVESGDGTTPEEEAESYLSELVYCGMLLVETTNLSGRLTVIKMHDVMREFALKIAKNDKFCGVYDGRGASFEAYRWSLTSYGKRELLNRDMSRVRSVVGSPYEPFMREDLLKFKMLRLLDLPCGTESDEVAGVWRLFNLRYLRLSGYEMNKLPSSIHNLLNLQTLDISETSIYTLPEGVSKLRKLRHLILVSRREMRKGHGIRISFDISKLNELQVLIGTLVDNGETLRQVATLTQLVKLDMAYVRQGFDDVEKRRESWVMLGQSKLLQSFLLYAACYEFDRVGKVPEGEFQRLGNLPLNLEKLYLNTVATFQPRWVDSLQNVQKIRLVRCTVKEDELHRIGQLEKLVSLDLSLRYDEDVHFRDGFAKLKQLWLRHPETPTRVSFEKGVMPHTESLIICYRSISTFRLEDFPEGVEHLKNLQKLELEVFKQDIDRYEEQVKNWKSKVQHLPTISVKSDDRYFE